MNKQLIETAFAQCGLAPAHCAGVADRLIARGDDIDLAKLRQEEIEHLHLRIANAERERDAAKVAAAMAESKAKLDLLEHGYVGLFIRRLFGDINKREGVANLLFATNVLLVIALVVSA